MRRVHCPVNIIFCDEPLSEMGLFAAGWSYAPGPCGLSVQLPSQPPCPPQP